MKKILIVLLLLSAGCINKAHFEYDRRFHEKVAPLALKEVDDLEKEGKLTREQADDRREAIKIYGEATAENLK